MPVRAARLQPIQFGPMRDAQTASLEARDAKVRRGVRSWKTV